MIGALWLLCMFAAATHAAHVTVYRNGLLLPLGTGVAFLFERWQPLQAEWVGASVAVLAVWQLLRGLPSYALLFWSGVCAGWAAALLASMGLPWWLAVPLCLIVTSAATWLNTRRSDFAPTIIKKQALLGLAWLAPCVAAAPGVISGWQSAQRLNVELNVELTAATARAIPAWCWQLTIAALLLGVVRGLWGRR